MLTRETLGGALAVIIILAALLAVPLSYLLNYFYRRYLSKGMGYRTKPVPEMPGTEAPPAPPVQPRFTTLKAGSLTRSENQAFYKLKELLGLNWLVYVTAWGAGALVMTYIYSTLSDISLSAPRLLFFLLIFAWPVVLCSMVTIASSRLQRLAFFLAYAGINMLVTLYLYVSASDKSISYLVQLSPIVMYNGIPTLLVLLLMVRSIRGSSFTVSGITLVAFFTATLLLQYISMHLQQVADLMHLLNNASLAMRLLWAFIIVVSLLAGFVVVRSIRFFYNRKRLTEQTLMIEAILILHLGFYAAMLEPLDPFAVFYVAAPFVLYKMVSLVLFRVLRRFYKAPAMKRLLLLRVFALEGKSRNLLEHLTKHWRFHGPVQMISGPDLATSTIDPHEVITFLSGGMHRTFCDDEKTIKEKTEGADNRRDFDATYRIQEYFCRDNTWKHVLAALVHRSEVVLMDLRSFNPKYKGCQHEINQLVNRIPLNRVVFLVDKSTVMPFTEGCFTEAFARMEATSPNAGAPHDVLFVDYTNERYTGTLALLNLLCRLADGETSPTL